VKRTRFRLMMVAAAATSAMVLGSVGTAGAAPPTGANGTSDTVFTAGSDTTYPAMTAIGDLYNGSPGCTIDGTNPAADSFTKCLGTPGSGSGSQPGTVVQTENYDHDVMTHWYPQGSGAGIRQLTKQGQTNIPQVDIARSSRDKQASDAKGLRFVGYAKDGIMPIDWRTLPANGSQGAPSAGCKLGEVQGSCTGTSVSNLTTAQLVDIFVNCNIRDWRQLSSPGFTIANTAGSPATPADYKYNDPANLPIYTWFIQSSSGTGLTWTNFLGASPGACPTNTASDAALFGTSYANSAGRTLFENNAQAIPATNDVNGRNIRSMSIWGVSFGRWLTALNERAGSSIVRVNGVQAGPGTIGNSSYAITRLLWNVVPTTTDDQATPPPGDAVPGGTPPLTANRTGSTTAFVNWLCASSANHSTNPFNNRSYFDEITSAVNASGFVRGTGTQASPPGNGICYNQYTPNA
jgi:ABC-type phosphate transport system substrate-binding protein